MGKSWTAPNKGATNLGDPEAALAGMAKVGNPRVPMGNAALTFNNASATNVRAGQVVGKKGPKGGAEAATANRRGQIAAERLGARYAINVKLPGPSLPEAAATQANGRIISSATPRVDFTAGAQG